ncbi:hypothetical protein [Acidovorax sp.]|uniref:hypothetical protein n=1 Tax=Acidovorax sp. TaxID=1872122 RepID=UPI002ACDF48E|nr:hypothetical protein [Acidovorax sp.]MDZ7863254.1 hypothetical protein [Acidovorax sp.]
MLYYFAYCTWLNDPEIRRFWPTTKAITKAHAPTTACSSMPPASAATGAGATSTEWPIP